MNNFFRRFNIFGSIRFYLFVVILLVGVIPTFFLIATLEHSYEEKTVSTETIQIISQMKVLSNRLVAEGYFEKQGKDTEIDGYLNLVSNFYDGRIMLINGDYKIIKDTYGLADGRSVLSPEVITAMKGSDVSNYDSENHFIEVVVPVSSTETTDVLGTILVSVSAEDIATNMSYMRENAFVMDFAILILLFVVALFGSGKLVKPFSRMSDAIAGIETDHVTEDGLNITEYSETRQISKAFNELLIRMKKTDDARNEFVSNVSHELKTPLTSMKVLADSLVGQEGIPEEMYQEFLTDIAGEIDRENNIINDLLTLVKMDRAQGIMNITAVNMNELIELVLKRLRPIAQEKNVDILFETLRPVVAEVDEIKMTQVITNLVENAVKYNNEGGWVRVSLNSDHQFFYLTVEDNGLGIPEEALPHVFERFYRADKSHSREIGGTGLGLAITRSSVLMHRGAIKVDSTLGKGSIFSIRIPLTYIMK